MNNRRLLFAIIFVLLFAVGVILWFFIYTAPKNTPSLGKTANPLSLSTFPKRVQFILNKNGSEEPVSESTTEITPQKAEVLSEIWSKPATGQTFTEVSIVKEIDETTIKGTTTLTTKKLVRATSSLLMFVDKTTGYVYAYNRELLTIHQVSNTTIPGVYDAYIFNNGKSIVLRYADTTKNIIVGILANIPSVNEKEQAKPLENISYLPSQVTSVAVNKKKTLLSYLVTGDSGTSVYTVSQKGTSLTATTPYINWSLSYGGDTLYATTKPSAYVEGHTVILPTFETLIAGRTGLMSNPSENGNIVSSMWSSKGLKTFLTNKGDQLVLTIQTIASKCVWGQKDFLVCAVPKTLMKKSEGLPDDWFQGTVSFDDTFVTINPLTGESVDLYSFDTSKKLTFDVKNISLSKDNSFIVFNRKQNSSLWLLDTNLIKPE